MIVYVLLEDGSPQDVYDDAWDACWDAVDIDGADVVQCKVTGGSP